MIIQTYFDERIPELQQIPENYNRPCRANKRCEHFSFSRKKRTFGGEEALNLGGRPSPTPMAPWGVFRVQRRFRI